MTKVNCSVIWDGVCEWALDFNINEPPKILSLPEPAYPERTDGLWQTTCFELFLQRKGEERYFEFNFSPSGQWAAYSFESCRQGKENLEVARPVLTGLDPRQIGLALQARCEDWGMTPEDARRQADLYAEGLRQLPDIAEAMLSEPPVVSLRALYDGTPFASGGPWRVGLSAVVEEVNGTKSYWALAHPSDKPDFHHPDSFVLELP